MECSCCQQGKQTPTQIVINECLPRSTVHRRMGPNDKEGNSSFGSMDPLFSSFQASLVYRRVHSPLGLHSTVGSYILPVHGSHKPVLFMSFQSVMCVYFYPQELVRLVIGVSVACIAVHIFLLRARNSPSVKSSSVTTEFGSLRNIGYTGRVDMSVGQFAQNFVRHGEGKLSVKPSNGLIKLENALSDCNINRQSFSRTYRAS
jgi:hypothetical protein